MLSTPYDSEMEPDFLDGIDLCSPQSADLVNIDPIDSLFADVQLPAEQFNEQNQPQLLLSLPVAASNRNRSVCSSVSDPLQDLEETRPIDFKFLFTEQQPLEQEQTPLTPSLPNKGDVTDMMFQQPLCSPPLECGNGRQFHSSASMSLTPMRFDGLPHHNYNTYADAVGRHHQALHPQHLLLQQQQQQQQVFDCRTLQSSTATNCQQSSLRTPTEWEPLFKMSAGPNIFQYPTASTPASVCVAPDSTGCTVGDEKPFSSYARQQQHNHQQPEQEQQRSMAGRKRSHSAAVTSSSARQSAQADMPVVIKKVGSRGRRAVNPSDCERVGASKVEQRQDRRRLSNRKAATKYREKQRKEIEGVRQENDRLVAENLALTAQVAALNKKLAEMKGENRPMFPSQQQLQSQCLRGTPGGAHW